MAKVLKSPLYYRCPESAKTFSSYSAWMKHAESLWGEQEARNRRAVEFRSYDRLIDVFEAQPTGSTGDKVVAKVRAVLYIEDLGPADETAVPLQPRVMEASQPLDSQPAESTRHEAGDVARHSSSSIDEERTRIRIEREIRSDLEAEMQEALKERLKEVRAESCCCVLVQYE